MIPSYKIEVYDKSAGDALLYTFGPEQVNDAEAFNINTEQIANNIGAFQFSLPAKKGDNYKYYDIASHDLVRIYLSSTDTLPSTPTFSGRIKTIKGSVDIEKGYVRTFSGSDLTILLAQRNVTNEWLNTTAHTIIDALADDLGLAKDTDSESNTLSLAAEEETYFDVAKKISDYWISGATQIAKDFWVEEIGSPLTATLKWKNRPSRTTNVETLTIGTNIDSYNVLTYAPNIVNNITGYGATIYNPAFFSKGRSFPTDLDSWTESLDDWSIITAGSMSRESSAPHLGTYYIQFSYVGSSIEFEFSLLDYWKQIRKYNRLIMYIASQYSGGITTKKLRLFASSSSNYFETNLPNITTGLVWNLNELALGKDQEYDSVLNPTGIWTKTGSPSWLKLWALHYIFAATGPLTFQVDGQFGFTDGPWRSSASDATSISSYGQRDLVVQDTTLTTDDQCHNRAETLLYQRKDPVVEIEVVTPLNNNIKLGDRLTLSIPAENISSQYFYPIKVQHFYDQQKTVALLSDNLRWRSCFPRTPQDGMQFLAWQLARHQTGYIEQR